MKSRPQAFEKLYLCTIPDRVAGREGPDRQVETHHRAPCADLCDRNALQVTAFKARELLMRSGGGGRDLPKAKASADARDSVILAQASEGLFGTSAASIGRSFACSHN